MCNIGNACANYRHFASIQLTSEHRTSSAFLPLFRIKVIFYRICGLHDVSGTYANVCNDTVSFPVSFWGADEIDMIIRKIDHVRSNIGKQPFRFRCYGGLIILRKGGVGMRNTRMVILMLFASATLLWAGGRAEEAAVDAMDPDLREAPMLAAMVAAGELDPLEDRLPSNPMIVDDMWEGVGNYGGGSLRKVWMGPSADRWGMEKNSSEYLVHISQDGSTVVPNIAHELEVLDDGRRFVFHIREGLRWSDGEPFTTEDVRFYWEHMVLAEVYRPLNPIFTRGGEVAQVNILDDYTFEIVFAESYYNFPIEMTMQMREFFYPAHYGRTILPEFIGEDAALALAQENGYANYDQFIESFGRIFWIRPEVPSMRPWVPVNDPDSGIFRTERNPYYFKVDSDGRQLPYIDGIEYQLVEDEESIVLAIIAGDVDFQDRRVNVGDFATLMENRARGDYEVIQWAGESGGGHIEFNRYPPDDVLGEIFRDVRFRRAISLSLDREEINEIVTDGLATPAQSSTVPGGAYFRESWTQAYAEYDPDQAASYLDDMGLQWDANRQWRLRPDGGVLEVIMTVESTQSVEMYELIESYVRDIGIRWITRVVDRGLREQERDDGITEASHSSWNGWSWPVRPTAHVPVQPNRLWSREYYNYVVSNGAEGVQPPPDVAELIENWNRFGSLPPGAERDAVAERMVDFWEENLLNLGAYHQVPVVSIISNRIGNHPPDGLVHADPLRSPLTANMMAFFFRQ